MPIIDCPNCGSKTNTAVCTELWDESKARCVAKIIGGKFVKGCGYSSASKFERNFADRQIERTNNEEET